MLLKIEDLDKLGCEIVGTMRYLPPLETLDRSVKRCIWSMGCVFFELVYGYFFKVWDKEAIDRCSKSEFYNLIKGMLSLDINKRFDLKDCKYELQNLLANNRGV